MKLISYYTDIDGRTFYSDHAKRLKAKCDALGVEHDIRQRGFMDKKIANDWLKAEAIKPFFIRDMFHELKCDLLWLDVDCDILKKPDFEIANEWGFDWRHDGVPCDYVHYIAYNENNGRFLDEWCKTVNVQGGVCTHTALIKLYKQLNWFLIPKDYFTLVLAECIPSRHKYLSMMDSLNKRK